MSTMHHSPAVFILLLMATAAATWSSFFLVADARQLEPAGAAGGSCIGRERDALLAFKQGISDPNGHLRSWQKGRQDCCQWVGVGCSNATGHVMRLDLGDRYLAGQISPSLLSLEYLEYLDLRNTYVHGPNGGVPEFLGAFKNLRHLDLSWMPFTGTVPPQLGNLSKLEYLDLRYSGNMHSADISWLTRLPLLVHLDMSDTNLISIAADWPLVLNMLPSLEYLSLSLCSISRMNRILTHINLTNLQHLDLSFNYFDQPIASAWFWNSTSLTYLSMQETLMSGPFPNALGNMTSLQVLDFGCYPIATIACNTATMTIDLRNLCDLEYLWLPGSFSSGNITTFLEKLPRCPSNRLTVLNLARNNMNGIMTVGLGQLTGLTRLDISYNNITGSIPLSIGNLSHLEAIDLSYNHLTGAIPQWRRNCTSLGSLRLSKNHLTGHFPSNVSLPGNLFEIDLSNNKMDGLVTKDNLVTLKNLENIDFSHNCLSGPLPSDLGSQGLVELDLSFNYFTGHIPESVCMLRNLLFLDLSNNFLEGELPHCSQKPNFVFLHLSNNLFSGKFPSTVQNYSSLAFLDLSRNNFYGPLPRWIGDLVYLHFLQLSHNFLSGDIPVTITKLKRLRQLSLAGNAMSGVIPWSLSNLTSMAQKHSERPDLDISRLLSQMEGKFSREVWPVVMKHQELKYGYGVFNVASIDLSLNQLVGGIPDGVTSLSGLLNLNLSWNHLSGKIPASIGAMKSIESLDLSRNNLSGEIPSSLSNLTYLSSLDLSYNNFEGRIPHGTQLDTLYTENPSIYTGNIGLCGPPLEWNCLTDSTPEHDNQQRREKVSEPVLFFYFGLGSGFLVGLWIVFCALLFKKAWRIAYFRLFDRLYDNAYVFVVVTWGSINCKATS